MQTWTFPAHYPLPTSVGSAVELFESIEHDIASEIHELTALQVLQLLQPQLVNHGFITEIRPSVNSKRSVELRADDPEASLICKFDAIQKADKTALMVHAGRGLTNNDFLRSLLFASIALEIRHLVLAVRIKYRKSNDYDKVVAFLKILLSSQATHLDLDSVTVIGY